VSVAQGRRCRLGGGRTSLGAKMPELCSDFMEPLKGSTWDREGQREALKTIFDRCSQAFDKIYKYEQDTFGSFWRIDERYKENNMRGLYERYCYAMGLIAELFHDECTESELGDAEERSLLVTMFLSGAADEVFKRGAFDTNRAAVTEVYYKHDEPCLYFWDAHEKLKSEVIAVRKSFRQEERDYLHGFYSFADSEKSGFEENSRDFLHVMRMYNIAGEVVVEKFLGDTKRIYLPTIIKSFMDRPKPVSKGWQFWKK
jgi:hypothetical protein